MRLQESVCLLIAEQASLDFHVGAVIVRQGCTPIQTVLVTAPRPYLLCGQVQGRRIMNNPSPGVRMIYRHIRFPAAVTKAGHRTVLVIADNALIHPL